MLYFLPEIFQAQIAPNGQFVHSILTQRGLGETFAGVLGPSVDAGVRDVTGVGPGGKSGCIICTGPAPDKFGYYAEQTWHQVNDDLWLSTDNPGSLKRQRGYGGYPTPLSDGNLYEIPVIRRPDGSSDLPCDCYWSDDYVETIKQQYRHYWDDTAEVADWFFGKEKMARKRGIELAIKALSLNYHYSKLEHRFLKLVDSTNWQMVLAMSVDAPAAQKKILNMPVGELVS
ncbi:MAG TPA: hypothetical protein VFE46_10750 [Pirellulales bacterium]|jgi:hypothetical protein|nr:hypothetical protein [Pirellulales bacterium]